MRAPVFTVFTPTYNRAHLLPHVYECLVAQTFKDFEWLIVDDGSTDHTASLVREWQHERCLEIVFLRQENRGKHVAFNRAVASARGELFLPLDSDDICTPNALERLLHHWTNIPPAERHAFSGVSCLCADPSGRIVGERFPVDLADDCPGVFLASARISGEKWGFHRTDVLRAFPFPEHEGERFVPEGLVWNRIGRHYKVRSINEALRVYEPSPDGLSKSLAIVRTMSPLASCQYYRERLEFELPLLERCKCLINYGRFFLHSYRRGRLALRDFYASPGSVAALPCAYFVYLIDLARS